jgi:hypothetical protein
MYDLIDIQRERRERERERENMIAIMGLSERSTGKQERKRE